MLLSSAKLIMPCLLRPNLLDTCPVDSLHDLVYLCLRLIRPTNVEGALSAALSIVEVPVRPPFGQFAVLLAPVGASLQLQETASVLTALQDGALLVLEFAASLGQGGLQPVQLLLTVPTRPFTH